MAYTKKTWVSGETPLSAENMNNIENGIANAHEDISELNTKIFVAKSTSDLNTAMATGMYQITNIPANRPSDWGSLMVFNTGTYIAQLFIGGSYIGTRFFNGSSWGEWKSLV